MNLICPRCQTSNERDARFCKTCGTAFNVQPIRRNSISAPVIVIIVVVALCGLCGIFGLVSRKSDVARTDAPVRQFSSGTENKALEPATNSIPTAPKKTVAGRMATVISENANLRSTPSAGGEIVETVPRDAKVEIVRRQGAWFYVNTERTGGWLHGNTIRLADDPLNQSPKMPERSFQPPKPVRTPEAVEMNNSGASAKCNDGTLSYSRNRRGTCSHHGGVAVWY